MHTEFAMSLDLDALFELRKVIVESFLVFAPVVSIFPARDQSADIAQGGSVVPAGTIDLVWKPSQCKFLVQKFKIFVYDGDLERSFVSHGGGAKEKDLPRYQTFIFGTKFVPTGFTSADTRSTSHPEDTKWRGKNPWSLSIGHLPYIFLVLDSLLISTHFTTPETMWWICVEHERFALSDKKDRIKSSIQVEPHPQNPM